MIGLPSLAAMDHSTATRIWLATAPADMRCGFDRLAELAQAGFDPVFGARPLKRAIQERIENPLAKQILEGRFVAGDTIRVTSGKGGGIGFAKG